MVNGDIRYRSVDSEKLKNLSLAKNSENMANFKLLVKAKANQLFVTHFFIFKVKIAFIKLQKTCNKSLIVHYFEPKPYI